MTQDTKEVDVGTEVVVDATDRPEPTDIIDIVDDLIVHLHEAKTMPLSSNALVERDMFLDMLERLKAILPDELRAARWMAREREAFIARTNEKARELVDKARAEADDLVSESHVVAEAVEEANILVRRAEGEARRLRLETEDDIEKKLQRIEGLLVDIVTQVNAAREELHQARPKAPEVPI